MRRLVSRILIARRILRIERGLQQEPSDDGADAKRERRTPLLVVLRREACDDHDRESGTEAGSGKVPKARVRGDERAEDGGGEECSQHGEKHQQPLQSHWSLLRAETGLDYLLDLTSGPRAHNPFVFAD